MIGRLLAGLMLALVLLAGLALAAVGFLYRSLPARDETREVAGLTAPATIGFDSAGVPVLSAASLDDLSFLAGWAHARDRRFQMELQRRSAAGRIAELVGPAGLRSDRRMRTYGFAAIAETALARLAPARRARFEAYAAGVNAWDRAHPAPPEFGLLRLAVEPWRPADCLLTVLLMFEQLNEAGDSERMVERMDATLPAPLTAFLLPDSTPGDVPLAGGAAPLPPPIPDAAIVNLREAALLPAARVGTGAVAAQAEERARGSNNWAVGPARTGASALLAGDPHLGLRVPVIWHRQRYEGAGLAVTGITLPGAPGVVAGATAGVAWAMTNVEPDVADLVRLDVSGDSYAAPGGSERFRTRVEVIAVRGAAPETLRVRETRWGPVIGPSASGGLLALQWAPLDPAVLDFDLFEVGRAASVDELFAALDGYRGPAQNWVAADRSGRIGWRIAGALPKRAGFDARRPREGADPAAGWTGWWRSSELPGRFDPPDGILVTANQRTLGGPWLEAVGRGFAMPYRARRIADALSADSAWTVERLAALQNDVADDFLLGPAAALDRALTPEACAASDTLARVRRLLGGWTRRADTTSVAHAYLRYARAELNAAVQGPLVAPCVAADSTFVYSWPLADEVTRRLLAERPHHLLDPAYDDWDALVRAAAVRAARALGAAGRGAPFDSVRWGLLNRARIRHPLAEALPALGRWLDMPDVALAGGASVVRVARPRTGASMRLVANPADPHASRFVMPGGQSGHFLSRHYGDQFADWVAGRTRRFEPTRPASVTRLTPAR